MIAFVQPYGLQAHGGGARILRSLLADAPVPFAIVNTSPWPGPVPPSGEEIRLRRRPAAGRLEATRLAPVLAHADIWFGSRFRDRLHETCRDLGATAVHAVAHGPEFWHAYVVARELGISYALCVHDDLPYNLPGVPYLAWVMDRLGDAWRGADVRFVISQAMGEALNARYGVRPYRVVTDGLTRVADGPRRAEESRLHVYLMGSIHLSYERNFADLFRALARIRDANPSVDVRVITRGGFPFPVRDLGIPVETRPWGTQEDIDRDMEEVDLLYLPLPFDPEHASFARYSLATKLVTYLGSGLPILMHGPADSAAARLLQEHDAAILATAPDHGSLADAIADASSRTEAIAANALRLARSHFMLEDQRRNFWDALLPLLNGRPRPSAPARRKLSAPIA